MTTRKHPGEEGRSEEHRHRADAAAGRPAPPDAPETQKLLEKIAELESALAEARDRHLRLAADFDNFKKRSRQEQLETIQHASADLIARLLPALDDLHNALEHMPDGTDESWAKGMELGVRKLEETLSTHGLQAVEAVGRHFDPKVHEAIGHEETADVPEDTVVSELRRGYRVRDRVVRPALVKIARAPASLPPDTDSE